MEILGFDSPPHTPLDKSDSEGAKLCAVRGCSTSQSAVGWSRGLIDVVYNAVSVVFFHAFLLSFPGAVNSRSLSAWIFGNEANLLLGQKLTVIDVALLNVATVSR